MTGLGVTVTLDPLPVVEPFDSRALLEFFGRHTVPGVETYRDVEDGQGCGTEYARTLRLPHGPAAVTLTTSAGGLSVSLDLSDARDLGAGRERVAQLCDLSTDPVPIAAHLGRDPQLRPLVTASPGLRVPGTVDLHEHLFRTMIGQQISLAGAASCAGKLVARFGEECPAAGGLHRLFPTAEVLAAADPETLPMPRARGRALVQVAAALAGGSLVLHRDVEPGQARAQLLACPGIGPWTADYVLMRGLRESDILLSSDLAIKRELGTRGITDTARWSPWRSYATMHLWRSYTG